MCMRLNVDKKYIRHCFGKNLNIQLYTKQKRFQPDRLNDYVCM